ncbi:TetR family transcriptional regulator [Halosquirtibacter xylanolyticus]|nr:TetR family transcriptional regulator [Prolixibacteraceae bacterium]
MSILAKRVGISPSTLYVYFETKEDLIIAIGIKIHQQIAARHRTVFSGAKTVKEQFYAKWKDMLVFMINNEREINFLDQLKQSPYQDKIPISIWENSIKMKTALFDKGKKSGEIKDLDNKVIMFVIGGMVNQTAELIKLGIFSMKEESLQEAFSLVWDALSKK